MTTKRKLSGDAQGSDVNAAQICNLPYRRIPFGGALKFFSAARISADTRILNPRYGRLKICATILLATLMPAFAVQKLNVLLIVADDLRDTLRCAEWSDLDLVATP